MFLVAIARPRPQENFDGRVLLAPITEDHQMLKGSPYAKRGEIVERTTNMNKAKFYEMIKQQLIPNIIKVVENCPSVRRVTVQMDNAPAHGGGRADMERNLVEMNSWTECRFLCHSRMVRFIAL